MLVKTREYSWPSLDLSDRPAESTYSSHLMIDLQCSLSTYCLWHKVFCCIKLYKVPAGWNAIGPEELAGTNAILLAGGSNDKLVLLIVLSIASAAFRLDSFLDLPFPVHRRLPIVTVVSKVLWWGGPSPLVTSNSGFCRPFLATTSWRWPTGLLWGANAAVVVHCWQK